MYNKIQKEFQISLKESMHIVLRTNIIWQNRHIHNIMSKLKHYWWKDNNYIEKLVIERFYDFPNI